MDDSMLQLEMYRKEGERTVSETLMTVRLNSSHVLHTRLNWRPRMLTDLQVRHCSLAGYGLWSLMFGVCGDVGGVGGVGVRGGVCVFDDSAPQRLARATHQAQLAAPYAHRPAGQTSLAGWLCQQMKGSER